MANGIPTTKVGAGALAGAVTAILIWVVGEAASLDVPGAVGAAITTVLTFVASYFVKES